MRQPDEAVASLLPICADARPQPAQRERREPRRRDRLLGGKALVTAGWLACLLLPAAPALGDEFPKRKPGLWEMRTSGGPIGPQTLQQCIDAATDDMLRFQSSQGRNCSKPTVERDGNRYRVSSTCNDTGMRSTMDGLYTMVGNTGYRGDMKMTFDPPLSGVAEMNMKMEGRWLGACKRGMKPGDIVLEGMPRLNALEIGKDGGGITAEQAQRMADEMQKNMRRQNPDKQRGVDSK
jgi:hypothetical protein